MKKWVWGAGLAVVIIAIVAGSVASSGPRGEKVFVEPVAKRDIEAIVSAPGEIDPKVKVSISAHVIGKIEKIWFREGDLVSKGQRLVDLEKVALTAQRDRARSDLANRRIEVDRSRIRLADAQLTFQRAENLRQQGIQAEDIFDRARFDLQTAKAQLASAEEGVHQAEAMLRQAEDDLDRTTLISPISGRVVQLNAHEGEVVITGTMNNPGSVIAVIADLSEILVQADVAETEVVKVRQDQPARVTVDAMPDKTYHGRVVEIGSSATSRSAATTGIRYFTVKVVLDQPDEHLRPGMTAQVDVITDSVKGVVAVPVQCVVERTPSEIEPERKRARKSAEKATTADEAKKKYVFVVEKDKTKAVEVTTGISDALYASITSGLSGGETIVTGPFRTLKKLKSAQAVQAEKETRRGARGDDEGSTGDDR